MAALLLFALEDDESLPASLALDLLTSLLLLLLLLLFLRKRKPEMIPWFSR